MRAGSGVLVTKPTYSLRLRHTDRALHLQVDKYIKFGSTGTLAARTVGCKFFLQMICALFDFD